MVAKPSDPQDLLAALNALALTGQVKPDCALLPWLASVQLVTPEGVVDHRWLNLLPAMSDRDLIRIGLLRDPGYRWHLECGVTLALTAMAQAGNWRRLEEVLTGPLKGSAGRIAGILMAQQVRTGRAPNELRAADWASIDPPGCEEWDLHLWGHSRIIDALPVIMESYPRFATSPVGWGDQDELVFGLIPEYGCTPQTVIDCVLSPDRMTALYLAGCPIVPLSLRDGSATAWTMLYGIDGKLLDGEARIGQFWDALEGRTILAMPGAETFDDQPPQWQSQMIESNKLPREESLRRLDTAAVIRVAADPVHGLLLQLLIQDALDGELRQDRIALCPVLDDNRASLVDSTLVLYRPMDRPDDLTRPMRNLGRLDQVLGKLASLVGFWPIPATLISQPSTWTVAFTRLVYLDWISDNGQRWHLANEVFDRLHAAGLMQEVIRRARLYREHRMLPALKSMWDEAEAQHG